MIPPKSHPRFRQLVTGELNHSFKSISTSMFGTLLVRRVQAANQAPAAIIAAIDEVAVFFDKYESIVSDDLKSIFGK